MRELLCQRVHKLLGRSRKFNFPFEKEEIPFDGIYILFERGQKAHGCSRIVRIGTHTGDHNLPSRVFEHFVNDNKDRSIFRRNIGRALLNRDKDAFLKQWNWDLTTRKAKLAYARRLDQKKQAETEKRVTRYIRNNLSFAVIPVRRKRQRLELEARLIALVAQCSECKPPDDPKGWLGSHSPIRPIRDSGLWQRQHLRGNPLTEKGYRELTKLVDQ